MDKLGEIKRSALIFGLLLTAICTSAGSEMTKKPKEVYPFSNSSRNSGENRDRSEVESSSSLFRSYQSFPENNGEDRGPMQPLRKFVYHPYPASNYLDYVPYGEERSRTFSEGDWKAKPDLVVSRVHGGYSPIDPSSMRFSSENHPPSRPSESNEQATAAPLPPASEACGSAVTDNSKDPWGISQAPKGQYSLNPEKPIFNFSSDISKSYFQRNPDEDVQGNGINSLKKVDKDYNEDHESEMHRLKELRENIQTPIPPNYFTEGNESITDHEIPEHLNPNFPPHVAFFPKSEVREVSIQETDSDSPVQETDLKFNLHHEVSFLGHFPENEVHEVPAQETDLNLDHPHVSFFPESDAHDASLQETDLDSPVRMVGFKAYSSEEEQISTSSTYSQTTPTNARVYNQEVEEKLEQIQNNLIEIRESLAETCSSRREHFEWIAQYLQPILQNMQTSIQMLETGSVPFELMQYLNHIHARIEAMAQSLSERANCGFPQMFGELQKMREDLQRIGASVPEEEKEHLLGIQKNLEEIRAFLMDSPQGIARYIQEITESLQEIKTSLNALEERVPIEHAPVEVMRYLQEVIEHLQTMNQSLFEGEGRGFQGTLESLRQILESLRVIQESLGELKTYRSLEGSKCFQRVMECFQEVKNSLQILGKNAPEEVMECLREMRENCKTIRVFLMENPQEMEKYFREITGSLQEMKVSLKMLVEHAPGEHVSVEVMPYLQKMLEFILKMNQSLSDIKNRGFQETSESLRRIGESLRMMREEIMRQIQSVWEVLQRVEQAQGEIIANGRRMDANMQQYWRKVTMTQTEMQGALQMLRNRDLRAWRSLDQVYSVAQSNQENIKAIMVHLDEGKISQTVCERITKIAEKVIIAGGVIAISQIVYEKLPPEYRNAFDHALGTGIIWAIEGIDTMRDVFKWGVGYLGMGYTKVVGFIGSWF